MLKNYVKIAFRNLLRYKVNSAINVLGLVVGLSTSIMIGLYLNHEFSFDSTYPDADRIYRVNSIVGEGPSAQHNEVCSPKLNEILDASLPQIEYASTFRSMFYGRPINWNERTFFDFKMMAVEEDFVDMFGLSFITGDASGVFAGPNGVIISESLAQRIFGDGNPVGQNIIIPTDEKEHSFEVRGVFQELPANTHFQNDQWKKFTVLTSLETLHAIEGNAAQWGSLMSTTYIKTAKGVEEESLNAKINELLLKNAGPEVGYVHYLQPVSDIHLNQRGYELSAKGDQNQLYLFSFIAILILLIACINYVNITTAQAMVRFKEVGVRKVVGARREQFIVQFMIEAAVMTFISLIIAMLLVTVSLPILNSTFSLNLSFSWTEDLSLLISFLAIATAVSLLCGTYPGVYLSRTNLSHLVKSSSGNKSGKGVFRKVLVVLQFSASMVLIIATLVISDQLNFIREKNLGFQKDQIVYLKVGYASRKLNETLLNQIHQQRGVLEASLAGNTLGDGFVPTNEIIVSDTLGEKGQLQGVLKVEYDFAKVFELNMVEGRWFSSDFATDRRESFVVNQAFVDFYNLKNPIGETVLRNGRKGTIIGVTQDFHFKSMHHAIEPLLMRMVSRNGSGYGYLPIRLSGENIDQNLADIQNVWETVIPDAPFSYEFLDEKIDAYYKSDRDFAAIFQVFSILTIIISCLGLIGLISFSAKRRSKEIGVRKVLGASEAGILGLISKELVVSVTISAIIAIPLAYMFMKQWLENFEYRTDLSIWSFVLAFLMTMVISWLSVGYISIRVAKSNPVDSLRRE